jgi:hypothetical protein
MFGEITRMWWLFLITGIAWVIIALVVLRFDTTSLATVGALLGVVFLLAGLKEFMLWTVRRSWRWAHFVLGVIFVIAAIAAFATPYSTFWSPASILGFLLVLKGSLDIIASAMTKDVNELGGLAADRHPRADPWLLGFPAVLPRSRGADPDLGGAHGVVPGHFGDRSGVPGSPAARDRHVTSRETSARQRRRSLHADHHVNGGSAGRLIGVVKRRVGRGRPGADAGRG